MSFICFDNISYTKRITMDDYTVKSTEERVMELNNLLNKIGAKAQIETYEACGETHYNLYITYDEEEVNKKTTRGAGAKRKTLNKILTVEEVKKRLETETADDVAKDLGISRATFFRKMKENEGRIYFE